MIHHCKQISEVVSMNKVAPKGLLLLHTIKDLRIRFVALLAMLLFATSTLAQMSNNDFLPVEQAFLYDVSANADDTLTITWDIAPDYYLYRHQLKFEGEPQPVADVRIPDGKPIEDEFFGESEVYYNQVAVTVDPGQAQTLNIAWQGCAEAGLCYPPQRATLNLTDYNIGGSSSTNSSGASSATAAPTGNESTSAPTLGEDQSLAASLADGNTAWVLAIFFGLGLLLVLTPCVLPMVPILTSLIVGSGARGKRGFVLSVAYVLPMAATYALLGVAAALAGASLQAVMQTPWVLGAFALVFVTLALSMFGVYELQLPAGLRDRLNNASNRQPGGSLGGAAILGVLSALLVGPCMTAPLAGALLYIADSGNVVLGGSALFMLGLGMGAPLVLAGSVGAHLLPKPGPWMTGVKVVFGFVMLGTAIWFVERVVADNVVLSLWGAWLVAIGITLYQLAVQAATPTAPTRMISRIAGLLIGLWGGLLVIGAAGGADSIQQPLAFASTSVTMAAGNTASAGQGDFMDRFEGVADLGDFETKVDKASANGQWTLVDFYADWCISCKVIEEEVFGNSEVQQALGDFQLLRPDVTKNDTTDRALMQQFGIIGPPTILLIGPDGQERRAARVVGELSAGEFMQHLSRAKSAL
jgi:thiol:disulfide interchange protein DsbD